MARYQISELARRTGTKPATLRFYEQAGLLPAARSDAGYRIFGDEAVERIAFIASGKRLGLTLTEVRELLDVWQDGQCADVRRRLRPTLLTRAAEMESRVAALRAVISRLRGMAAGLEGPPPPGRCQPDCGCFDPHLDADPVRAGWMAAPRPAAPPAPVACTLADADRAARIQRWQRLLAKAQRREPIDKGVRIHLPVALAGPAAELAAAEQDCCAFFAFSIHLLGGELLLEVRVPDEAAPLLAEVFGAPG